MDVSSSTSGSSVSLDGPTGQAQVLMLRDALQIERTQSASLLQTMPQASPSPPPSLEQGKGASIDRYA
ncbi:MAG TPA: hypothetical protein VGF46_12615 [Gaiellales bacterium]